MTYAELKAQFTALLNRTDLTTPLTELFINQSITRTQRKLRVPAQEKVLTTPVTLGFTGVDVPADYISTIAMMVDDISVQYLPLERFQEMDNSQIGQPVYWTRIANQLVLKPTPATSMVVETYYYGEFETFASDSDTTTLSLSMPDVIIYGALSFAADYYIDERAATFEARYIDLITDIQNQAYDTDGPGVVQPAYDFGDD